MLYRVAQYTGWRGMQGGAVFRVARYAGWRRSPLTLEATCSISSVKGLVRHPVYYTVYYTKLYRATVRPHTTTRYTTKYIKDCEMSTDVGKPVRSNSNLSNNCNCHHCSTAVDRHCDTVWLFLQCALTQTVRQYWTATTCACTVHHNMTVTLYCTM